MPTVLRGGKGLRYLITGGATFVVNLAAVWLFMEWGLADSEFKRNVAHLLGAEVSFLFGFNVNNYWTWENDSSGYVRKLFQYHVINGVTLVLRQAGFFAMDSVGFHWFWSTSVPLALSVIINFLGYDRLIFRDRVVELQEPHR